MAQFNLTLKDAAGNAVGQYNISTSGAAQHIQAVDGVYYQITDLATGIGPESIITDRVGDDLLVSLDRDQSTDLVIENYFKQSEPGALVGLQENGGLFSYRVATVPEHVLAEEIAAASEINADTPSAITPLAILGGVALVAGGIALASGGSDKGSGGPQPAPPVPEPPPFKPTPEPQPKPNTPINPAPEPLPDPNPNAPGQNPAPGGGGSGGGNGSNPNPQTPGQPGVPNPDPNAYRPVLQNDSAIAKRGETTTINVTKNDTDPQNDIDPDSVKLIDKDGKEVTTLVVDKQGTWSVSRGGNVTFTPLASFKDGNPDPVEYTLKDRNGNTSRNKGKISITYDDSDVNHDGKVEISGNPNIGEKLNAGVSDEDGVPKDGVKYQWLRDGKEIVGATQSEYTLTAADKGSIISVHVEYTDEKGNKEAHSARMSEAVDDAIVPRPPLNHEPIGKVEIEGEPKVSGTLKASHSLQDQDGMGPVTYRWYADGKEVGQGASYTLKAEDKGKTINVRAEYTDGQGYIEKVSSTKTAPVVDDNGQTPPPPPGQQNHAPTGSVTISGKAVVGEKLTASNDIQDEDGLGTISYRWFADGVEVGKGDSYTLQAADKGKTISAKAEYTDGKGTAEAVESAKTAEVTDAQTPPPPPGQQNHAPTGSVSISGKAQVGEKLTASNDIQDEDGLGTITYRWFANGVEVGKGDSYTLQAADKGKTITAKAEYTDGKGTVEAVESAKTAEVTDAQTPPPPGQQNHAPIGSVTISGKAVVGEKLTANNDIQDEDGLGTITYRWFADGVEVGKGDSYTLQASDKGKTITAKAEYTDGKGTAESVESAKTAEVADAQTPPPPPGQQNHAPTGSVTISGKAVVGEKLTASNDLQDEDGLGTITYRWFANGVEVGKGDSYTLQAADKGKTITAKAEYTDGKGTLEAVESAKTAEVADAQTPPPPPPGQQNHAPTGSVSISGKAVVGERLTASNDIQDEDGLGTITYRWFADGVEVGKGDSYTLQAADKGKTITAKAEYTDGKGTAEAVESARTAEVADAQTPPPGQQNHAPTGSVSISGKAVVGEKLTASNDIQDEDGLGTISYRWFADGVEVGKGDSYTLQAADKGKTITAKAEYTDGKGTAESVESAKTVEVSDSGQTPPPPPPGQQNHAPTGSVTISGKAVVGEKLTASNDIQDEDGLGTISYRWFANGIEVGKGDSYTLQAADKGKTITAKVEYTDGKGTLEAVESAKTAEVADAQTPPPPPPGQQNHAPTGSVTISGKAVVGEKLTASNDIQDEDGLGTISYRWFADGVEVGKGDSYTLQASDKGKTITAKAEYTDGKGTLEAVESAKTAEVEDAQTPPPPPGQQNHAPTGSVTISGKAQVGEKLTASNDIQDEDGLGTISYRWFADGKEVGQGDSYTLQAADKGKTITAKAEYTDGKGTAEAVESAKTAEVTDAQTPPPPPPGQQNHVPTGSVTISGKAVVGEKLTASNDIQDEDGLGTISYRWFADGVEVGKGDSYTLQASDKGKTITAKAEYTDGKGTLEAVESAKTAEVADAQTPLPPPPPGQQNHAPTGSVTISGKAQVGEKLTASNDIQDEDGLGTISYRWFADGKEVGQGDSYTLQAADKGKTITAKAEYTDGKGTAEAVESAKTAEVTDAQTPPPPPPGQQNHVPTGSVTISGKAVVGEKLTASNDIQDEDGLGTITYRWFANGVEVGKGDSYTLQAADKGKTITAKAEYTDGKGTAEAVESAKTAEVTDAQTPPPPGQQNHAPTGSVSISGKVQVGEKLTASNDIQDEDGLGTITYRWFANGVEVGKGDSYTLQAADKGKTITAKAEYTDGKGTLESVESAKTAEVEDAQTPPPPPGQQNHAPTGSVTISGKAVVGEKLTASNDIQDEDGLGTITYRWFADGVEVGKGDSYTLQASDKGKTITAKAEYTDGKGTAEAVESVKTAEVADAQTPPPPPGQQNHAPTGSVSISGKAQVGEKLTASNDIQDEDGVGTITYRWFADGVEVGKGDSYTLQAADKGKTITAKAEYTDGKGTAESVESAKTAEVADAQTPPPPPPGQQNHAPTGSVSISGKAVVGEKLTASNDLTDEDGLGTITYRWFANGVEVGKGDSYTLQASDKGKTITAKAEYTDGKGTAEAVESAKTGEVSDNGQTPPPSLPGNHAGFATINGNAKVGEVLTAAVTDSDNLASDAQYQWLRDGKPIDGATEQRYRLSADDEGKTVSVKVEYTDGKGHYEVLGTKGVTVAPESATNHKPFIDGDLPRQVMEGQNGMVLGKISVRDEDAGDTHTFAVSDDRFEITADGTFKLKNNQHFNYEEEKRVSVRISVDDGHGGTNSFQHTFQVQDDPNWAPGNPPKQPPSGNHTPTGSVSISGKAVVGEKLTASNDIQDEDGLGTISYRWFADGVEVGKGDSYTLQASDKGKTISVKAEYTDGKGTVESVESAKTAEVGDAQTPPPVPTPNHEGTVSISGEASVGNVLTAEVKDDDGVPDNVAYQWLRDGKAIDGATGKSYTLTAADAGHKITVQATYDDKAANHETPLSDATDIATPPPVAQPQVSISGSDSVQEGEAASYTVTLDKPSDQPVTVTVTLKHGESSDSDFTQPVVKTLTIPAGQTSATFSINTADDKLPENDEKYTVEISAPQGAKLAADKAGVTTTIVDNDETAANHNGTNTDTAFAGDRNAETPYFVKTLDSGYNGSGHLAGHKPGEGLNVTYAFATTPQDEEMQGFQPFSEQQKADIRTVLDHIAEHVNVKYSEGDNATLNFYKNTLAPNTVGQGVYGGNVYLSASHYSADDAFRHDIPYKLEADDKLTQYTGWHAALHEVGHTLALNHTFKNKAPTPNLDTVEDRDDLSVMSYTAAEHVASVPRHDGDAWVNVPIPQNKLGIFDLAALHHSFGVNPEYHNGDDTYTFKEFNKDAIGNDIYIHDGGGLDTFDASEQTLDLNIDLTPGSWIHAGEKTSHLVYNNDGTLTHGQMFIGYGTQIENAKGGSGNDTIKGNSAANYLFGFDGDDTIDGGAGNDQIEGGRGADTLTGGKGADTFIFASPLDGKVDTITDFNFSEGDLLQLDHNIFTALEKGTLAADQFVAGKEAKDENDHLLYDRTTGELAYDPDGNGAAAAVTIARLGANHELDHNGINII